MGELRRVAVLGASGVLGSALVTALKRSGIEVIRVGRKPTDDVHFDLLEGRNSTATALARVDAFFHCGATFAGDDAEGTRMNIRANSEGAIRVAELLEQMQCRHLIYAGSISSYEKASESGSYGLSKQHAEDWLAWSLARTGGIFCSLRLCQIYDTEGRCCVHQPWFGRIVAYTSRGLPLRLPPDGAPRSFLHVDDAAGLMVAAARAELSGVWPACHTEKLTYEALAYLSREVFETSGPLNIDLAKKPFRSMPVIDSSGFFREATFTDFISMRDGLERIRRAGMAHQFGPMDLI